MENDVFEFFFFQAEDGIRDGRVTGVQTCALPILRDQLGLRRVRTALTGGAPLGPDTFRLFRSIGVNLKQVYGCTEVTGLTSLQPDGERSEERRVGKESRSRRAVEAERRRERGEEE